MAFYVSNLVIHNRAPFEHLELDFEDRTINVLSAINGGGKTTILSHITDAWFEIVRLAYNQEFTGKEGKYYRVSSPVFSIDKIESSIFYVRFTDGVENIDYIDLRGEIAQEDYDNLIKLDSKINYQSFINILKEQSCAKYVSQQDRKKLRAIFDKNIVTSFPAYRYEEPGYLNDPFKVKLHYKLQSGFTGYLHNPIEVISGLPELANWLMDILLDQAVRSVGAIPNSFIGVNNVFTESLCSKGNKLSIGIGNRNQGSTRIQVGERDPQGQWTKTIYPSIFNMSSGEDALVCIFGEIIRQFDNIMVDTPAKSATGIVLIDEVDKHLHIKLQKEVLPKLFAMFPNIQFITSSHSPFVTMGLAEQLSGRTKIIDLDHGGIIITPEQNDQYKEVYKMMISENERYAEVYRKLADANIDATKLLIVTEGDNIEHIKKAIELRSPSLASRISYVEGLESKTGKDQLLSMYKYELCKNTGNILFVFDCDVKAQVDGAPAETEKVHKFAFEQNNQNDKVKKGIENLYPKILFTKDLYPRTTKKDDYGASKSISTFDKNGFIEKIKISTQKRHFVKFQPLINKMAELIGKFEVGEKND